MEKLPEAMQDLADRAKGFARDIIRDSYERVPYPEQLSYHCWAHTDGVTERAERIARAMGCSDHEVLLTIIAARFHDTKQGWRVYVSDGLMKRQRFAGFNEVDSAAVKVSWMKRSGYDFSPIDYGLTAEADLATIPDWDATNKTVVQPFLTPCSSRVARAVALADINGAGMDAALARADTISLFIEENISIIENIKDTDGPSEGEWQRYHNHLLAWIVSQKHFLKGRKKCLPSELRGLKKKQRKAVAALFTQFDSAIANTKELHEEVSCMGHKDLALLFSTYM